MCKSNCQGSCKVTLNHKEKDSKELLMEIVHALEKMISCSAIKFNYINPGTSDYTLQLNSLKAESIRLLAEVNCYEKAFPNVVTRCNSSFVSENVFEEYSVGKRIKQLADKFHLLETIS